MYKTEIKKECIYNIHIGRHKEQIVLYKIK